VLTWESVHLAVFQGREGEVAFRTGRSRKGMRMDGEREAFPAIEKLLGIRTAGEKQ
jgi:hypothetical protein